MKKKKMAYMAFMIALAACDEHTLPDADLHVGMVYCTDGAVLSLEECQQQGKQPKAVVFYVDHQQETEGLGYAVTLRESPERAFCDTLGISQGTSAVTDRMDGFSNTFQMRTARAYSSLAYSVEADCFIPSVAQMNLLHSAIATVNPILEELGGQAIPQRDNWYWTSTEVAGQSLDRAWIYSLMHGQLEPENKLMPHTTRPILTIYNYKHQ